jgi:ferrochelatase
LLTQALDLRPQDVRVAFQSRFGRAKWLGPSTESVLQALGAEGKHDVDVMCPGFSADCLETLEEIAMEGKETFEEAGGGELRYIPCLNDSPEGMRALTGLAERHLQGWPTQASESPEELAARAQRARSLGASA